MEKKNVFVFLVLGIVCPRKNQIMAVEFFREMKRQISERAQSLNRHIPDVKLRIVGARRDRSYEIEYLDRLVDVIGCDDRDIEVFDVTDDVTTHYASASALLFPSINEVTPLVIVEAMSCMLPVISTDVGGINEMIRDGVEGYVCKSLSPKLWASAMVDLVLDPELCCEMGRNGQKRHSELFNQQQMATNYQKVIMSLSPPVVLVDMDGIYCRMRNTVFRCLR